MDKKTEDLSKVQRKLLKKNIICIEGKITLDTFDYVRKALVRLLLKGNPPAVILITSSGGEENAGKMIYDLFGLYQGKITGIAVGYCHSMASVILQGCGRRLALKHALICSHFTTRANLLTTTLVDAAKMEGITKDAQKSIRDMAAFYKKTGKTVEEIEKFLTEDKTLSAEEAVNHGVIDKVIETLEKINEQ